MPSDFEKSARVIRVAQIAGAISIISDPANGFAEEKGLRTTVLAVRLARGVVSATKRRERCSGPPRCASSGAVRSLTGRRS